MTFVLATPSGVDRVNANGHETLFAAIEAVTGSFPQANQVRLNGIVLTGDINMGDVNGGLVQLVSAEIASKGIAGA